MIIMTAGIALLKSVEEHDASKHASELEVHKLQSQVLIQEKRLELGSGNRIVKRLLIFCQKSDKRD